MLAKISLQYRYKQAYNDGQKLRDKHNDIDSHRKSNIKTDKKRQDRQNETESYHWQATKRRTYRLDETKRC